MRKHPELLTTISQNSKDAKKHKRGKTAREKIIYKFQTLRQQ